MLSNHLPTLRTFPLFLGTSTTITLLPISLLFSSIVTLLFTPSFLHILGYFSHFCCPQILSFLILSCFVTPHIHLNILIFATSNFFYCAFLIAHASLLVFPKYCILFTVQLLLFMVFPKFVAEFKIDSTKNCNLFAINL